MPQENDSIVIATGGYVPGIRDRFLTGISTDSVLLNSFAPGDWRFAIVNLGAYIKKIHAAPY